MKPEPEDPPSGLRKPATAGFTVTLLLILVGLLALFGACMGELICG